MREFSANPDDDFVGANALTHVYVVSQNDFPVAVFRSLKGADAFIAKQPKKTEGGRPIYWHSGKYELED